MTSDEINALPERVRLYIHDLETRCDPAGEVRDLWAQREAAAALAQQNTELRAALKALLDTADAMRSWYDKQMGPDGPEVDYDAASAAAEALVGAQ